MNDLPMLVALSALLAQTGALFYWGGKLTERVRVHEEEIGRLRHAKHTHANLLAELAARVQELEDHQ